MSIDASGNVNQAQGLQANAQAQQVVQKSVEARVPPKATSQMAAEAVESSAERLQKAAEQLNQLMQNGQRRLNFSVDENSNQVIVKVVDKTSQEVIRQIPGPEAIKIAENLDQVMGVIFNRDI
ncbi:MAG: flagellar protein FlaG [Oceanospirillaceae bacterium]|nr:flagellar protein FlaG [Oceanospirillaceae bacterium]